MIIPSGLTLKFKFVQKVELINSCNERLIYDWKQMHLFKFSHAAFVHLQNAKLQPPMQTHVICHKTLSTEERNKDEILSRHVSYTSRPGGQQRIHQNDMQIYYPKRKCHRSHIRVCGISAGRLGSIPRHNFDANSRSRFRHPLSGLSTHALKCPGKRYGVASPLFTSCAPAKKFTSISRRFIRGGLLRTRSTPAFSRPGRSLLRLRIVTRRVLPPIRRCGKENSS